jgi:hypothetical protein
VSCTSELLVAPAIEDLGQLEGLAPRLRAAIAVGGITFSFLLRKGRFLSAAVIGLAALGQALHADLSSVPLVLRNDQVVVFRIRLDLVQIEDLLHLGLRHRLRLRGFLELLEDLIDDLRGGDGEIGVGGSNERNALHVLNHTHFPKEVPLLERPDRFHGNPSTATAGVQRHPQRALHRETIRQIARSGAPTQNQGH